ncbi:hypothetical protein JJB09_26095 [Rhizobium sp. KVB221]|uniref:Transmembrane protein n=1 Tax=Rhizobium setariae TaxID=2801340 RepID=A0A936YTC4_9HYPH|nr:hypothetical protein [Rhizobium setariae]MBL0375483.1 hypothetical protein [Rhizobium setariae]
MISTTEVLENSTLVEGSVESSASAVSWGAILAGAFAAAALTLMLLLVGAGLGLTLVSPWPSESASLTTVSIFGFAWLVFVQWISAGAGGYIAGRLRTKWVGVHSDEIYFRDTAHGFMAWAAATLLMAALLGSTVSSIVSAGTQATTAVAGAAASAAATDTATDVATTYFSNAFLRPANPTTPVANVGTNEAAAAEITNILVSSAAKGDMTADDRDYLNRLVAARTGLSEADAKARVDAVMTQIDDARKAAAKAAEKARKASATSALLGALSLFIGALIASASAALGGMRRDAYDALMLKS